MDCNACLDFDPNSRSKLGSSIGKSGIGLSAGTPLSISLMPKVEGCSSSPVIEELEGDGGYNDLPQSPFLS